MQPGASEKGLNLRHEIAPGVPPSFKGDPLRLRQVLLNLVSNAIKFTERGEVALTASIDVPTDGQAMLHLAVTDTGIGIPTDRQALIFDAFAQEDASITRRYGGTGLGLTICSRLISLMGGTITVDSHPGRGSEFHVRLPLLDTTSVVNATKPVDKADLHAMLEKLDGRETSMATPATSDFDYTAALAKADAEIVSIIAQEFLDLAPADLAQMRTAATEGDLEVLGRMAHTYKGLAANFCARPLQEAAGKLHDACRHGEPTASALAATECELLALCVALQNHLAQSPA